ncbi:hypothetical protein [Streptomyces sp. NPDC056949]|uniref:hypothetical protein n=1 Tax=Streptomyces sp. NPDC056949 TaxID=3345976 RepID=UPI0036354494
MSLTFHWFLPTNGDSRHVVGGGHGTPVARGLWAHPHRGAAAPAAPQVPFGS